MKQFIVKIFAFSVLLTAILSCEYEPSGENYRDIAKPDTTKIIQINLSPFETEYIITYSTLVSYDLNTFDLKVYNVEFFVGDQSVYKGNEATGVFGFDPAPFGVGIKTMTMRVTTNTNTGSVADLIGVEALIYEKSWNLLMDGGSPDQVEITRIYTDNGALRIEWEPYTRFNFQKFILYKNYGNQENDYNTHIVAEITNQQQNFFEDLSFIGGTGIYWVEVQASNKSAISSKKSFTYDFPKLDTLWVKGDSAKFIWRKNPFKRAVHETKLTTYDNYYQKSTVFLSSINTEDTTIMVKNLKFGFPQQFVLWTYPELEIRFGNDDQILKTSLSFGIGKSIPKSTKMICSPTENHVFLWDDEYFSKLDMSTKTVVAREKGSNFYTWSISNHDGNLYTQYYSKLTSYNKNNLQIQNTYEAVDFGFNTFWPNPSITKENRIAGPVEVWCGYYDLNDKRLLFTEKNVNYATFDFSPDGKYAFDLEYLAGNKIIINLFEVTESGMNKIAELPENQYSIAKWIQGEDHKFIALIGTPFGITGKEEMTVVVYDAQNRKNDLDFQVKIGHLMNIDFYTKQIAFWTRYPNYQFEHNFYIYNFETGKLVKELYVDSRYEFVSIFHSQILCSDGYCLDYSKN